MQLDRFLFAPVLLAVAVWTGPPRERPAPRRERASQLQVQVQRVPAAPAPRARGAGDSLRVVPTAERERR